MMRIALVQPTPRGEFDRHWARVPGLGLAYLASSLRADRHEVDVFDGKLDELTTEDMVERIGGWRPDLVGITCMTVEFPRAAAIAHRIRSELGDVPIVVGGAHVNAVGPEALAEAQAFDYACVGEGEGVARELAAAIERGASPAGVPGLVWRQGGQVLSGPPRPPCAKLDALPFPAWDLFRLGDTVPLLTHRGCPFRCSFCSHNSGSTPRYRSASNVLEEMEQVIAEYRPARIRFEDETFGLHLGRTKEILEGIISAGFHQRVKFSAQTRVDRVDEEFVRLLKTANFETLELGVESGNAEILRAINKGITIEQVEHAVALAKRTGLRVWCKFILGHPNETPATIRDTIELITRLNPEQLSVSLMTPFPGTPIYEMAMRGEGGYRLLTSGWEDYDKYSSGVLELEAVSLGRLKRYQIACYLSLYVRNRRLRELLRLALSKRAISWELARSAVVRTAAEQAHRVPSALSHTGATPARR